MPNEVGTVINYGSYSNCIVNMPGRKANIDESIAWYVANQMTNAVGYARDIAVTATNNNITIPAETWNYLNSH